MVPITNEKIYRLRPIVIRLATNYIALNSLLKRKAGLHQIFASAEWQKSRLASINIEGSHVKNMVRRQTFRQ